ncbi:MAG: helix-turn-helix transcriptional regulator [Deltaproteobacteria bacterium]|nr:helix-turn-helix transcriptional regulator [Deltaproteobacteria bacterium]
MVASAASSASNVRARALREARRLFAAHGFDGTALQDVADAVGVTKPSVLHHFPSKEALREAVLEELVAHWKDELPRLLLAASAGEDRFDAVFTALHRFFSEEPDRARVVLREALDRPEATRAHFRRAVRPWLELVAGYIRSGQAAGTHYSTVDAEAYVLQILGAVISSAACADVISAALPGRARPRFDRELARISKDSLFLPAPTRATKARR